MVQHFGHESHSVLLRSWALLSVSGSLVGLWSGGRSARVPRRPSGRCDDSTSDLQASSSGMAEPPHFNSAASAVSSESKGWEGLNIQISTCGWIYSEHHHKCTEAGPTELLVAMPLFLVAVPGATCVASNRSVRSDALCYSSSFKSLPSQCPAILLGPDGGGPPGV